MDSSIEIIGEVNPERKSEINVIYDRPRSAILPSSQTITRVTPKRPVRSRRPIKTLREEQQNEKVIKRKRSMQRPGIAKKRLSSGSIDTVKRSKANRPLINRGIKRKDIDIQIIGEVERPIKAPRSEVGGAGTVKSKKLNTGDEVEILFEWDPAKVIAERQGVEEWQAKSILKLFDQENTLPFIARYRKENTGNIEVEKLREIQNSYSQLKVVQEKVVKLLKTHTAQEVPEDRKMALLRATTVHEVEHLSASLKAGSKRSYAERARELGLNDFAMQIIGGPSSQFANQHVLSYVVNPLLDGLKTIEEVEQGIRHIIADVISKDTGVLDFVNNLLRECRPIFECTRKKAKSEKSNKSSTIVPSEDVIDNFKLYFNFSCPAWNTRPHQILAINRGEKKNILTAKIVIPDQAYTKFYNFCYQKWLRSLPQQQYQANLILTSMQDSWERLVKPFMQRHIRSQLTETAEIASVGVFTANLKKLLLTPPLRGKTVLAIDPGFTNGCKIGVTNCQGEVLVTTTIFPFKKNQLLEQIHISKDHNARTLLEIVNKYGCELIAVGNGTACRETERYLTYLIQSGFFEPHNVQYTIINENGASHYSVSSEAKSEFPDMDPNHVSAVHLARRLQDPVLEYVKVPPQHLGVGMYQHDIPERLMHTSLDSVMVECVSFVGVDINVASEFVLRKLSGLSKVRAQNIVEYRKTKGPFINRQQLLSVKGIGPRTFEQCAGFIRIMPSSLDAEIQKTPLAKKRASIEEVCPLDRTMIHPESYGFANKFMNLVSVKPQDIGSESFTKKIREFSIKSNQLERHRFKTLGVARPRARALGLENLAQLCGTSLQNMSLIIEGLSQPLDFDMRAQFDKPLFRKGITSIDNLQVGTRLTGSVRNVVDFGAFVDIGVGVDGLIHISKMNGMRVALGSTVEVTVGNLEKNRERIGLTLERVL